MNTWKTKDTDRLCKSLLNLKNMEECYAFLEDICTIKEIQSMAQRLSVATLLDEGTGYMAIVENTGASSATISRVNKCYEYGTGGYRTVLNRLKESEPANESPCCPEQHHDE